MSRIALPVALAAAAAVATACLLTACTTPAPGTVGSSSPASPSATKSATPEAAEPTASPLEAVLVVAAVDVDGRNVTASGYLQGVVTGTGTCVFTFAKSGSEFTLEHEATPDRSTTSCGTVQAPIERFQRGGYAVTVGMDVEGKRYTSPATTVLIP